jgi:hypothetical protein
MASGLAFSPWDKCGQWGISSMYGNFLTNNLIG